MATQTLHKEPTAEPQACKHYWVLPVSGDRADGVCKICGASRRFQVKADEYVWQEERAADAAYWDTTDSTMLQGLTERAVA